ncbi:alpha/beta hydrolase family protein [Cellvibrio mixtus]|uniref:alpha/beta hydrolase family protein n=1 Tax=Cellvibrio mixtus TaxID=39650 RepID=UPI0006936A81|nr:alpha/beta hydrolase [Cellvibrio mixtus]
MNNHKVVALIFLLVASLQTPVYAHCLSGVYSDGKNNTIVLTNRNSTSAMELRYLMLDGRFGATSDDALPFSCNPGFLTLNNPASTILAPVKLRRTLTYFNSVDAKLAGELIEPVSYKTFPLVVMVHGSEKDAAIGNSRALLLASQGIAVFVYDKRGTGQSEGVYTQNFELLAEDAAAAMRHARKMATTKISHAGFWGASQGGWVAPLAAQHLSVDFVVVGYGLVASPIEEDLDQMLVEARQKNFDKAQIEKIYSLSTLTTRILLSNFTRGFSELEKFRKKSVGQPAFNTINGEYSGAMLRMSDAELRRMGKAVFDNLELIWDYDSATVLKQLQVPMLWILADQDREAPSQRTLRALTQYKKNNPLLDIYIFPHTDHGMYEYKELPDGTRINTRVTDGYFRLIVDWIRQEETPFFGNAIAM